MSTTINTSVGVAAFGISPANAPRAVDGAIMETLVCRSVDGWTQASGTAQTRAVARWCANSQTSSNLSACVSGASRWTRKSRNELSLDRHTYAVEELTTSTVCVPGVWWTRNTTRQNQGGTTTASKERKSRFCSVSLLTSGIEQSEHVERPVAVVQERGWGRGGRLRWRAA